MATTKRKLTREELERDEVAESIQEFKEAFAENRTKIFAVIGVVVLAFVGTFAYLGYRDRIQTETSQKLNAASVLFAELPGLQDEEERNRRLEATITSMQELIDQYPDSKAAKSALFLKGNCYYYMDNLTLAQETFESYLADADTDEDKARGEIALGYTLENQFYFNDTQRNKLDEALAHFELAAQLAPEGSYLYYSALMNKARILSLTYKDAEALEIYKKIMEERPAPRTGMLAAEEDDSLQGGIVGMVNQQIESRLEPLSFYSMAKLNAERLEATSTVLKPSGNAESAEAAPAAQPTQP